MDLICGYKVISQVAIKPSYTTDGGVTYGTAGWARMLGEKHVGDFPNSVPESRAAAAVATSSLKVLVVMAIIGIVAASG